MVLSFSALDGKELKPKMVATVETLQPIETIFDRNALAEARARDFDFKEVAPAETLSEHALWCNGCLRCWDDERAEAEGWRGI